MAYWNHCFAISWLGSENVCAHNIVRNASEDIKQRFLPKLCNGEAIGALGCTEPGAGSDIIGSMSTTAVRDGDDYVLNGRKMFITNGSVADMILTYARTDAAAGARGISAFVVEKGMPGFAVAQKLDKMGWRGSPTVELVFDDYGQEPGLDDYNQTVGMRFNNINIEPGSVVTNAWIQFTVDETSSEPTSLVIQGEASPDAAGFSTTAFSISSIEMNIRMIFFLVRKPNTPMVNTARLSTIYQLNGTIY